MSEDWLVCKIFLEDKIFSYSIFKNTKKNCALCAWLSTFGTRRGEVMQLFGSISQHHRKGLYLSAAKASTTPRRNWAGTHNWTYLWGSVCNDKELFFFFSFSFFFSKADSWVFRMYLGVFSEHCAGVSLCSSQEAQWCSWSWNLTYALWELLRNYFFQDNFSANKGILQLRPHHSWNVWSLSRFSPFHLRLQSNCLYRHKIKYLFHVLVRLGHIKRSLLTIKCTFKKAWSQLCEVHHFALVAAVIESSCRQESPACPPEDGLHSSLSPVSACFPQHAGAQQE